MPFAEHVSVRGWNLVRVSISHNPTWPPTLGLTICTARLVPKRAGWSLIRLFYVTDCRVPVRALPSARHTLGTLGPFKSCSALGPSGVPSTRLFLYTPGAYIEIFVVV